MMRSKTGEMSLPWSYVTARRIVRQGLDAPSQATRPADIVRTLCGAHAQVVSAAFWSIGLRSASLTTPEVRDALWTEHSLVKTFGPRGTVHLLAAQDLPLWAGALSAIPPSHNGHTKEVRLTPEQTDEVVKTIAVALFDAELTIDELSEAVITATGPWAGERNRMTSVHVPTLSREEERRRKLHEYRTIQNRRSASHP